MAVGPVVQVLVGLVFMFFVFSVLSSGVNEYISRALQKRVDFLAAGIAQLLGEGGGLTTTPQLEGFWNHTLVKQLGQSLEGLEHGWILRTWRKLADAVNRAASKVLVSRVGRAARLRRQVTEKIAGAQAANIRRLPSYIPTATFVAVVEDVTRHHPPAAGSPLKEALDALHDPNDAQRLANYGRWFNDQMDRVTGWYKRESKSILFVIGLVIVVAMNVDTIAVARTLWRDPTTRALINQAVDAELSANATTTTTVAGATAPGTIAPSVALKVVCKKAAEGAAGAYATQPVTGSAAATTTTPDAAEETLRSTLDCATQFPIGWRLSKVCYVSDQQAPKPCGKDVWARPNDLFWGVWHHPANALIKIVGLLMTAAALSFGAPFWFEFLNKFANLRGAGAKPAGSSGTPDK